uniref:Uncharacterized protein n=1 Tax=Anguilla anguilla TaxID=7936 RepID=A0A0E9T9A2_ANGAN
MFGSHWGIPCKYHDLPLEATTAYPLRHFPFLYFPGESLWTLRLSCVVNIRKCY